MGDMDIHSLITELKKYKQYGWNTPLLKDQDGNHYVIREGIHLDKDNDIIIPIELL